MQFHEKRRQQFLSEQYFEADIQHALDISIPGLLQVLNAADSDAEDRSRVSGVIAYITCKNFFLNYTAGESIAVLRDSFISVVEAYERASRYYREYTKSSDSPNFGFQEIDDFERIIQLVGLAILLHQRELIPRIHSLISNSVYDRKDAMYEELIGHDLPDRPFLDAWYHQLPYLHLLNATDEEDSEAKIAKMEQYLKVWYASMKNAGWHDSHLDVREDGGAYFGYWAIEAAAIVYLYNIKDSSFRNHIVYPKDLVDFARQFDKQAISTFLVPEKLRVEGGNPCPQTGYWFTPAIPGSLRHFEQGEIMPVSMDSQYGATIWQWSSEQLPP
ncbi:PoNe immunity protein domain-containing protein [Janthinobacterium sp. NKUCC06_STL]|uniref:PoNe immunity protein domain-containing protein n=1 Tax=Janthinobacterium sp. NKUCC06_STL TaxID=2842127 RepID=UPI001C5A636F|nr:PoNe immunity protein domain-containing protein [Janthinobacterium sp. NKUCC06_STL]MBW3510660.1 DUF1911 domain-containing protein [Janthinobacterium sp. NKUCC06_STL]